MPPRRARVAAAIFVSCGGWLIGLGLYFIFIRPALLPEDLRFLGASATDARAALPDLERWLRRVFTVMGGFMTGAGFLTILIAINRTALQGRGSRLLLAMTGVVTVGTMSLTNMQLDSDYKWLLLVPSLVWLVGVLMLVAADAESPTHATDERQSIMRQNQP